MYEEFFERNYGVFSHEEQERIRRAKIILAAAMVGG